MSVNPTNAARRRISERVRRIEIGTRRLSTDAFHGGMQSRFRGRGMNFDEVREYEPGDDVRAIDWSAPVAIAARDRSGLPRGRRRE